MCFWVSALQSRANGIQRHESLAELGGGVGNATAAACRVPAWTGSTQSGHFLFPAAGGFTWQLSWRQLPARRAGGNQRTGGETEQRWGTCLDTCLFICLPQSLTDSLIDCLPLGMSQRLVHLLTACDSAPSAVADRSVLERLWVHFLSSLESFLSDLKKTHYLIGCFPLSQQSDRRSLVNTGWQTKPTSYDDLPLWAELLWLCFKLEFAFFEVRILLC